MHPSASRRMACSSLAAFRSHQAETLQNLVVAVVQHVRESRPAAWGEFTAQDPATIACEIAKRCMPRIAVEWPDFIVDALNRNVAEKLERAGIFGTVVVPVEGGYGSAVRLADLVNGEIGRTFVQEERAFRDWMRDFCDSDYDEDLPSVTPSDMQVLLGRWRHSLIWNLIRFEDGGTLGS